MHMLLFDIVPPYNDALLVSFNQLLYPFEREAFQLPTKPRLHCLLDITMRAKPVLHMLTWVIGLLWSRQPPSACVGPCVKLMADQVGFHPLHLFFPPQSVLSTHRSFADAWCAPYCANNIRWWISADLTLCPQKTQYGALFLNGAIAE
jgi:hypothetical protein